jgi:predicted O-methyltransferase YrrM
VVLPDPVAQAHQRASELGFGLSCENEVGLLLAALSAATPLGGRVVELGTGVGVGLSWIIAGLGARTDVQVHSVEHDPQVARAAASANWPDYVTLHAEDVLACLPSLGAFDLIFADAQGGKTEGLELTLAALAPGGQLLVDDMTLRPADELQVSLWPLLESVRQRLTTDPRLQTAELDCATGLILATKRHHRPPPG